MRDSVPVFVSSTFVDLQPYRQAVRDALHRLEAVVRGMEYFGALPETPRDECLRIVRSCNFYVGIFAMRYGSIDAESGKSLTRLEYEEAQRQRLPSLIYLLDEERQPVLPKHIEFGESAERLREFKRTLKSNHVVSFFTTPEDLAVRVSQDLPGLIERSGTPIKRGELVKVVESLPRVNWLTPERFEYLKKEMAEAAQVAPSDEVLREVMEYLLAGDRLAAVFLVARRAGIDLREATDGVMKIERRIFGVVERGARLLEQQRAASSPIADRSGE
jgi:hypothetical protein